ncbi:SDR family NAD(P)-dependent oxidoreductase [Sphingomonas sp. CROZ-RG-20F-R02-07]|uniref:SDR family NAD(P)-dependent oxidoreductase n=1 Tax=Sphingomonas sp. CROZ-RG-20F-R02-07 TaxID=2914832 RepID=UPI001F58F703|nr:SDR family NAD(P)-dependent oxidoreductase [Sphingomonas sp. CROZ-RG-20F-R02-07]
MSTASQVPFAVITGASSGIGLELAKLAAADGFTLLLAADRPFDHALADLAGALVDTINVDLSTAEGVAALDERIGGRRIDVLCANAGHGLGQGFLDQDFVAVRNLIETNVVGTLDLLQRVGRRMRDQRGGRILITGSIAGLIPGAYQAAYNASKAFLDNFSYALRNELQDTGVSVTCLMPGLTESDFWERADTTDTPAGSGGKDPPDAPARAGWEAMKTGAAQVSPGWLNTLQRAILHIVPDRAKAEMNARMMRPNDSEATHG